MSYTLKFGYDEKGTRVSRLQTEGTGEVNPSTTKYLTDYSNPTGYSQTLAETDANGDLKQEYTYGNELLSQSINPQSAIRSPQSIHSDHLGSARLLTNTDGDAISESDLGYTPYGDLITGTGSLTSAQFTGQHRDSLTNLKYHRARWLNTSFGNWLSVDTVFDFPNNYQSHPISDRTRQS